MAFSYFLKFFLFIQIFARVIITNYGWSISFLYILKQILYCNKERNFQNSGKHWISPSIKPKQWFNYLLPFIIRWD